VPIAHVLDDTLPPLLSRRTAKRNVPAFHPGSCEWFLLVFLVLA